MRTLLILVLTVFAFSSNAQFKWPNGAKAAVVFTYDDGLDWRFGCCCSATGRVWFERNIFLYRQFAKLI